MDFFFRELSFKKIIQQEAYDIFALLSKYETISPFCVGLSCTTSLKRKPTHLRTGLTKPMPVCHRAVTWPISFFTKKLKCLKIRLTDLKSRVRRHVQNMHVSPYCIWLRSDLLSWIHSEPSIQNWKSLKKKNVSNVRTDGPLDRIWFDHGNFPFICTLT